MNYRGCDLRLHVDSRKFEGNDNQDATPETGISTAHVRGSHLINGIREGKPFGEKLSIHSSEGNFPEYQLEKNTLHNIYAVIDIMCIIGTVGRPVSNNSSARDQ